MNAFTYIALIGWIPTVLFLFAMLPKRNAVIGAFIFAWLFLPVAEFPISHLPDYNKMTATSYGAILGVLLFDASRLLGFRPKFGDWAIAVWCFTPVASSVSNGLGVYDGMASVLERVITWGLPYFIGRLYFSDIDGLRALAMGIFYGGLAYMPLCLFEIRMSPQLHYLIYGFSPTHFVTTIRLGGYRPLVFMKNGLAVGLWMTASSLIGTWLVANKSVVNILSAPAWAVLAALLTTTVLCKSLGALLLLAIGLGTLFAVRYAKMHVFALILAIVPVVYVAVRISGLWTGESAVDFFASTISPDRAASLETRLKNETVLADKALDRPILGWGGWGRSRIYDDKGRDITIADGTWIIAFGVNGFAGLAAVLGVFIVPAFVLARRVPGKLWAHPIVSPASGLVILLLVSCVDNLMNAMFNPIFMLAAGGLIGFQITSTAAGRAQARQAIMQRQLAQTRSRAS